MLPKNVKIVKPKSEQEWLDIKAGTIGGSELAAICGLNPYQSPRDIWLLKTKRTSFPSPTLGMKRGKYFEDGLVNMWADETGNRIIKSSAPDVLYINKDFPFLSVTPDRRFFSKHGGKRTLEAKTTFGRYDEPLDMWLIQLCWELGFTGDDIGEIVWEYPQPNVVFRCQEYHFDPSLFSELQEIAKDFWNNYVLTDIEPPCTTSADVIKKFPSEEEGKELECGESLANYHSEMLEMQSTIKKNKKKLDEYIDKIKVFMEDAEKITFLGNTLFTWRARKDGVRMFKTINY